MKVEYKLPKRTTLGEPVILLVRLHNTTGGRMVADLGTGDQTNFIFRLVGPNGVVSKAQPQSGSLPQSGRGRHTISRNTSYTAAVVLDQWLSLSQEGRYQLEVDFDGSVALSSGEQAGLNRTARLTIDVVPRNVKQLAKRCEDWLKKAATRSPGSEARAAGVALTLVRDPVAVPYLEQAVVRTREAMFVEALRTMGGDAARGALERLARVRDAEVASQARNALKGLN